MEREEHEEQKGEVGWKYRKMGRMIIRWRARSGPKGENLKHGA
jgi:hypothetical protein